MIALAFAIVLVLVALVVVLRDVPCPYSCARCHAHFPTEALLLAHALTNHDDPKGSQ